MGLPGLEQVADQNTDRRPGKDVLVEKVGAVACHPAQSLAQRQNEQQLNQVVDEQAKKTVQVTTNEQAV